MLVIEIKNQIKSSQPSRHNYMFWVYYQQYSKLRSTDRRAWCVSFELMWSFKLIWNCFTYLNTLGFQDQVGGSVWVKVFVVAYLWFEFWSEEEEWAETTVFEINMSLFMYDILCGNSDNVCHLLTHEYSPVLHTIYDIQVSIYITTWTVVHHQSYPPSFNKEATPFQQV